MKTKPKMLALAAALALFSITASATPNLVVNGDFENGATGWTATMGIGNIGTAAHSGTGGAGTGCVLHGCVSTLGSGAYIGQTVATNVGSTYDLSFWVGEDAGPTSELSVFWNGILVADVLNPANNKLGSQMVQYTFSDLVATSSQTAFEIHGRQDPAGIFFDDVSLTEVGAAAVPEPASIALTGLGLAALGAFRRKSAKNLAA